MTGNPFNEAENAWLLTLPEVRAEGRFLPVCTIVAIRTVKDTYFPQDAGLHQAQQLTKRTCLLTLWRDGRDWNKEQTFRAIFTVDLVDGKTSLDLADSDFILDTDLRGRGLGSWIMQQLVCWSRTLPADTPVRRIHVSPVDEDDEDNHRRRDRFWHNTGFRFPEGKRLSRPFCVSDLCAPEGWQKSLSAVPLHQGVDALSRRCERQQRDLDRLEATCGRQTERIRALSARLWNVMLSNLMYSILISPLILADRTYRRAKAWREKKTPERRP